MSAGHHVLFAFEEAIGFMFGTTVLDKDGVSAAAVMAEYGGWLYAQGESFHSQLEKIYLRCGCGCVRGGRVAVCVCVCVCVKSTAIFVVLFLRSFFVVLLLLSGRCYEAEICVILFLLRCSFRWYPFLLKSKIFIFWPKTMDYNKAF